jgi:hypothetical protein
MSNERLISLRLSFATTGDVPEAKFPMEPTSYPLTGTYPRHRLHLYGAARNVHLPPLLVKQSLTRVTRVADVLLWIKGRGAAT